MQSKNNLRRVAAITFLFVGSIAACRSTQPASEQVDDAWITTKVKSKLVADPDVNPFNVSVATEEGVVYLTGRVNDAAQKDEAERLAAETEGVTSVVNHIQIGDRTDGLFDGDATDVDDMQDDPYDDDTMYDDDGTTNTLDDDGN